MFCSRCGVNIKGEPKICPNCGAKLTPLREGGAYSRTVHPDRDDDTSKLPEQKKEKGIKKRSARFSGSESTPWRHDPVQTPPEHSLLYKVMSALTGALLFAAVVLVIFALRITGGF